MMNKEHLQVVPSEFLICPIIECSGAANVNASKINDFLQNFIQELKSLCEKLNNTVITIAPIKFNSKAEFYKINGTIPVDVRNYIYEPVDFDGIADIKSVVELLESRFTTKKKGGLFNSKRLIPPIVLFISDGYFEGEVIIRRGLFKVATKFAIAFNVPNYESLSTVVGSREAVICVNDTPNDYAAKQVINWIVDTIAKYDRNEADKYWNLVLSGESQCFKITNKVHNDDLFIGVGDDEQVVIIDNLEGQYCIDSSFSKDDLETLKDILTDKDNYIHYIFKGGSELFVLWRNTQESETHCHVIAPQACHIELPLELDSTDDLF